MTSLQLHYSRTPIALDELVEHHLRYNLVAVSLVLYGCSLAIACAQLTFPPFTPSLFLRRIMTNSDHRVTLNRRHAYRTKTNRVKTILTPGGRHVAQLMQKHRRGVICGDAGCNVALPGIKHMDRAAFKKAHAKDKTVSRAYGGSRCGNCVRSRIVRAFLIEEQKIVKKVLAEKLKKKSE